MGSGKFLQVTFFVMKFLRPHYFAIYLFHCGGDGTPDHAV
jgi:hypothetical protein